jgi:hypothetical protein
MAKKPSKQRARTGKGNFVADDPSTPENEAWVEETTKKVAKFSYGITTKKDFPPPGTPKHKMMVLSGEIKE